jgi:hypothetical protein
MLVNVGSQLRKFHVIVEMNVPQYFKKYIRISRDQGKQNYSEENDMLFHLLMSIQDIPR